MDNLITTIFQYFDFSLLSFCNFIEFENSVQPTSVSIIFSIKRKKKKIECVVCKKIRKIFIV